MEKFKTFTSVEDIKKYATEKGFDPKKLEAKLEISYLPKTGKFIGFEVLPVSEEKKIYQIKMYTTGGGNISIGTIRALAYEGKKEDVVIGEVRNPASSLNGKFVMKGTKRINPQFGVGTMVDLVAELMNREFTAEPVPRWTLLFNNDGYTTEAEAREHIINKEFYKIQLVPVPAGARAVSGSGSGSQPNTQENASEQ